VRLAFSALTFLFPLKPRRIDRKSARLSASISMCWILISATPVTDFFLVFFFYVLGTLLVIIPSPLLTKPLAIAPRSAPPRPESAKAAVPRTSSKRKATAVDSMGTDSCKQYLRDNNINFGRTRALAKLRALVKQHQNSLEPAKKKTKRG
jgi:hypothetical protein